MEQSSVKPDAISSISYSCSVKLCSVPGWSPGASAQSSHVHWSTPPPAAKAEIQYIPLFSGITSWTVGQWIPTSLSWFSSPPFDISRSVPFFKWIFLHIFFFPFPLLPVESSSLTVCSITHLGVSHSSTWAQDPPPPPRGWWVQTQHGIHSYLGWSRSGWASCWEKEEENRQRFVPCFCFKMVFFVYFSPSSMILQTFSTYTILLYLLWRFPLYGLFKSYVEKKSLWRWVRQ